MRKTQSINLAVVLFINIQGFSKPLICYETTIFTRKELRKIFGQEELSRIMPDGNGQILALLKNNAFVVRFSKIKECQMDNEIQANDFKKIIWPNQIAKVNVAGIEFNFRTVKCNY